MSGSSGYLVTGMEIFLGLLIGLLIYLFIPEEGGRRRKKRKQALARMNDSMAERTDLSEGAMAKNGHTITSSLSSRGTPLSPIILPADPEPFWDHERMNTFYRRYVVPHRKVLEHAGYLLAVTALLSLLDQQGDCPSVVRLNQHGWTIISPATPGHENTVRIFGHGWGYFHGKEDRGYQPIGNVRDSRNIYDLLAEISLLDHSLNVAEKMIQHIRKTRSRDPELLLGKILVTALGHDVGKIPHLIGPHKYSKGDHSYISYLVLKRAIFTDCSPQQEEILKAVREHHLQIQEGLTYALRKADQAAREMETEMLASAGKDVSDFINIIQARNEPDTGAEDKGKTVTKAPQPIDLDWLDIKEFLGLIEPHINVEKEGRYQAFSMNHGLVYLTLDLVSETVILLAKKHAHPEVLINADTREKKRQIEYTVKTLLNRQGFIPSFIGDGYSGARFALLRKNRKKTIGIYMPVDVRAFGTCLGDLEKRKKKAPFISRISEVHPLVGKKK
ncbi:MAG: hypothetical protein DRG82_15105 [Deltaproteobacteria bacterium]|nr:MAG: hypothetical protein DRG82_15105 [Deltaproteobacteria bacterium]